MWQRGERNSEQKRDTIFILRINAIKKIPSKNELNCLYFYKKKSNKNNYVVFQPKYFSMFVFLENFFISFSQKKLKLRSFCCQSLI